MKKVKKEDKEELDDKDIQIIVSLIEAASERGAVHASELTFVGSVYDKIKRIYGNN